MKPRMTPRIREMWRVFECNKCGRVETIDVSEWPALCEPPQCDCGGLFEQIDDSES
jgi:hypothetical protein